MSLHRLCSTWSTFLHLHRYPSRSPYWSSSTTIVSGGCTETTPSSAGRKGWGPSPDTKEANPEKCCFSPPFAVSGEPRVTVAPWLFLYHTYIAVHSWSMSTLQVTVPLSTLRMTFLFSMRALYRLTEPPGRWGKDCGSSLTWLKVPCCLSVVCCGTAAPGDQPFCWTRWTLIGSSSCSRGFIPGGAIEMQSWNKAKVERTTTDMYGVRLPSMPFRLFLWLCLCVCLCVELL